MTIPIRLKQPRSTEMKENRYKDIIMDVPNWTEEDVLSWVKRAGSSDFIEAFKESKVDGDLLLRLTEEEMKEDLGMKNGILRKRFIRELTNLKKCADYSCIDKHGIVPFLASIDLKAYAYGLIKQDMNPELMKRLNYEDLHDMLKEAGVNHKMHRHQIIEACKDELHKASEDQPNKQTWDVYISHAGLNQGTTEQLASLLAIQLQLRGLNVFNPTEHLDLAQRLCDTESCVLAANAEALKQCKNVVLVLGDGALDGCINDPQCKDKMHREIKAALQAKDCNVIPVHEENFQFPEPDELPEDIRALCYHTSVRWIHDYQANCIDKLERFIRGETFLKPNYANYINGSRSPNLTIPSFSTQTSRSRTDSGRSSPSRLTPLKINYRPRADSCDSAISP